MNVLCQNDPLECSFALKGEMAWLLSFATAVDTMLVYTMLGLSRSTLKFNGTLLCGAHMLEGKTYYEEMQKLS